MSLLPRNDIGGWLGQALGTGISSGYQNLQARRQQEQQMQQQQQQAQANEVLARLLGQQAEQGQEEGVDRGVASPALSDILSLASKPNANPFLQKVAAQQLGAAAKGKAQGSVTDISSLLSSLPEDPTAEQVEDFAQQANLLQASNPLSVDQRQALGRAVNQARQLVKEKNKPSAFSQEAEKQFGGEYGKFIGERNKAAANSAGSLRNVKNTIQLIKSSPQTSWALPKIAQKLGVPQLVGDNGQIQQANFKSYLQEGQKIFGGRLTDRDVQILEGIVPQVGNSKTANLAIVNLQAAKDWEEVEQNKVRQRLIRDEGFSPGLEEKVQLEMSQKDNPYFDKMRGYAEMAQSKVSYDDFIKDGRTPIVSPEGRLASLETSKLGKDVKKQLKSQGYVFL